MKKRMKHASVMKNIGCSSNLSAIKGEGRHRNKSNYQSINNNHESLLAI